MKARSKSISRAKPKPTRQKHYGERYDRMRQLLFRASNLSQEHKAKNKYKNCRIAAVIDQHDKVQAVTVETNVKPMPDLNALEKFVRNGGGKTEYLNCNLDNIGRRAGR